MMVALEWIDVEPLIGYKVSDYIIQHKRVEDPSEAEIYTGNHNSQAYEKYYREEHLLHSTANKICTKTAF